MNKIKECFNKIYLEADKKIRVERVIISLIMLIYSINFVIITVPKNVTVVNLMLFVYKVLFMFSLFALLRKRAVALIELIVSLAALGVAQALSSKATFSDIYSSVGIEATVFFIGLIIALITISHKIKENTDEGNKETGIKKLIAIVIGIVIIGVIGFYITESSAFFIGLLAALITMSRETKENTDGGNIVTGIKKLIAIVNGDLGIERPRRLTRFMIIGLVIIGVTGFYITEASAGNLIPFVTAVWVVIPIFSALLTVFGFIETYVMRLIESILAVCIVLMQVSVYEATVCELVEAFIMVYICIYCLLKARKITEENLKKDGSGLDEVSEDKVEVGSIDEK